MSEDLRLVWMDLEMTGLIPEHDKILEIATIITNSDLDIIAHGPELVIHQDNKVLEAMDEWNQTHHKKSGLIERVQQSSTSSLEAEAETLEFIKTHVKEKKGILAGNSIWQDRRFIIKHMPKIDQYLHYRLLDVSTIKILANSWYQLEPFRKKEAHRAKTDIEESIGELKFYKEKCFKEPC
ncbi:MAG: oligoribonuclease [Oligoflexales bacterium]|nr:oligoribonuclease [Oligoflexales bacterium]